MTRPRATEMELDAIVQTIVDMPDDTKIDFLIAVASRIGDERDAMRAALQLVADYRAVMLTRVDAFGDCAIELEADLHARCRVLHAEIGEALERLEIRPREDT